ncbi:hypothetical protein [Pseudomonas sp. T8]|uniref:hypothetical protein n=1 Tax=Pseudomonas TaxID=286 RepID=UPI002148E0A4|nr:hypothetical protein [Pseudomonas sp. T8]UUT22095.1 hypothetical protein NRG23_31140 [Pseudomonas sp. T8]
MTSSLAAIAADFDEEFYFSGTWSLLHKPDHYEEKVVMGEWSDYFEDFPEEDPANFGKRNPDSLEGVMESTKKRVRERSIAERDEVRKKLSEAFSRDNSKKN